MRKLGEGSGRGPSSTQIETFPSTSMSCFSRMWEAARTSRRTERSMWCSCGGVQEEVELDTILLAFTGVDDKLKPNFHEAPEKWRYVRIGTRTVTGGKVEIATSIAISWRLTVQLEPPAGVIGCSVQYSIKKEGRVVQLSRGPEDSY